jgi:Gluconate 2-dehydrogenase subunit 3
VKRRTFLTGALLGGAAVATSVALVSSRRRNRKAPPEALAVFSPDEAIVLAAVAARIIAPLDAEKQRVVSKIDAVLASVDDLTQHDLKQLLRLLDNSFASLAFDGRWTRFTDLAPDAQDRALEAWRDSRLPDRRSGFQALQRLCLAVTYSDPALYPGIGYPGPPGLVRKDGSLVGGPASGSEGAP